MHMCVSCEHDPHFMWNISLDWRVSVAIRRIAAIFGVRLQIHVSIMEFRMQAQRVNPFSSPWLNKLLAEAFTRPALDGAEDALVLTTVFPCDSRPSLGSDAVVTAPWASDWLRRAVAAARKQPALRVAREVRTFADYMVEVVLLMERHGHFQDEDDRLRVDALLERAGKRRQASSHAAAMRLLAAAESPDAGRSDALAEALGPMRGDEAMVPTLLGLAALPENKRRARLHGMGMALLSTSAQGRLNG